MNVSTLKLQEIFYRSPYFVRLLGTNIYGYILARRRFSGKFKYYYEFFQQSQWWSKEKLREFQEDRLKEIIKVAYNDIPYYRKIFAEYGLTPADIKTIEDLRKLPILNKEIIRKNFRDLVNERFPKSKIFKGYSSGTTGQKLMFYLPKELAYSINSAMLYRFYSWAGVKVGDKRVTIGGRIFTKKAPYWVYNKAENQLLLSIHHLSEKTVDEYIKKIREFSPVFIQGHPSGIYFLANRIVDLGMVIPVRAVFTTGENLFDYQREVIEKAFGCKVMESYGLGESVIAAGQCDKNEGFHEASEYGLIEFQKDQSGFYRVIGTSLWNEVMPFIRYEIEDLVELSELDSCNCGRDLPIKIKRVIGRIDDIIFTPDGASILPVTIRMSVKPYLDLFETYQFAQIDKNEYIFRVDGYIEEGRKSLILRTLKEIFGEKAVIKFEKAEKLISQGGKIRNVVNLYKH